MKHLSLLALATFPSASCHATDTTLERAPVELGRVRWERDLERGLATSAAGGKPVFLLFQEVPGCSTCVDFGGGPLSQPLLVEAIEDELVPVCVFNNHGGDDARALERFGEPAWNNPVVRFVDGGGRDLVPRRDGVWSTGGIAARTVEALEAARHDVPAYLALLAHEADTEHLGEAVFAMHCFWEGEAELGAIDGVVAVQAGFRSGREVVTVTFHQPTIAPEELVARANALPCAAVPDAADASTRIAPESDRTRHLDASPLALVPLTPAQATKVNAALAGAGDAERWLSPRQKALAARLRTVAAAAPDALAGLQRPRSLAALADYAERLERALDDAEQAR
jgi:hypothetical protein